ncbi:MFS transporter [Streptomyces sp. NPDC047043]|uniref:MFS transporter n=1 Tax=Streptomyces sp. NPDC047043 TaxID=3154497 RepID=UPI00340EE7D7
MACVGVFVAYLPVTSVSVSLPAIQRALHASTSQLSWISDAFVLPMAALILTAGVFGDVHGRKKVFQAGLLFAAVGAIIALCAQSVQVLWVGQALAGMGAAALLPTTLALISHAVPDPHQRAKFVGLWAAALMTALAVGPLMAGVILDHAVWRWIYLPAIPVALLTMAVAAALVTDSKAPGTRRLDWPGQITAAFAITSLVYGVIEGGAKSFSEPRVIVALALAAASAVAFVLAEKRSASPMLDLALFRSPAFSATTLIAMISFLGLIGFFFVLSLYFGMVQRLATLDAAYRMLSVSAVCLLVGVVVGPLMRRVSARLLITTGLLVTAGALVSLTALDAQTPFGALAWRLALLGLGLGLVVTPMTATAVASVPHRLAGMAAAGNNAFRQVGGALGPAVLGVLLTTRTTDTLPGHLADAGVDGATAHRITAAVDAGGLGVVARMDLGADTGRALGALSEAFLDGLQLCLIVAAALALLAAVVGAVLLRAPRPSVQAAAEDANAALEREPAALVGAGAAHGPSWTRRPGSDGPGFAGGDDVPGRAGLQTVLTGRIRDAAGDGVVGATVTLVSPAGRQVARAVSHGAGLYELTAPTAGAHVLIAATEGRLPQATTVMLGEQPLVHDLVLTGNSILAGTVVSAGDRTPVDGALVTVTDGRGDVLASGKTDTSGKFRFDELSVGGDLTVTVNARGFQLAALPAQVPDAGGTALEVPLRLGTRLQGVVRAGAHRESLADARVTLLDRAGNVVATTDTDGDGAYVFTDLDEGSYSVVASGYPPVATTVALDGRGLDDVHLELAHPDHLNSGPVGRSDTYRIRHPGHGQPDPVRGAIRGDGSAPR